MRALSLLVALCLTPITGEAGALYDTFRGGILGIPWNATLDRVIGAYPDGDNVFATTPGHRAYFVKDGGTFLGVPRDRQGVHFGFDADNKLGVVAISYAYERKEELRGALISLLGAPVQTGRDRRYPNTVIYVWPSDNGVRAQLWELGEGPRAIVWLVVAAPGYRNDVNANCASAAR
jgi:hypothetical protein